MRIIVPFGAGGTGDALARIVAEHLSASLKQQFVVENRTGAGGMIGVQALASSAPDGYTVGITNVSTLSLIPVINPKNAYHPLNDFTHVAFVAGAPVSLAVFPKLGVKTLPEFIAYANKSAKPLTFASSGLGSDGHLIGEAIAALDQDQGRARSLQEHGAGADRRGRRPCRVLDLHAVIVIVVHPRRHADRASRSRRPSGCRTIPSCRPSRSSAIGDLVSSTWFSISGPAKLPNAIAAKLNREIAAAMAKPEVQARMRRDGLLTETMSPEAFTDLRRSRKRALDAADPAHGPGGEGALSLRRPRWVAKSPWNPHISPMMTKLYPNGPPRSEPAPSKPPPSREDLAARKARQAQEGISAMAEYEQKQRATLERTARLRAARLAREAKKSDAA